jgi:competence protein ComEA
MDEQTREVRFLIMIAAVLCAVIIGYNAFYVPDAPLSEPTVTADLRYVSSSEAYAPSSVPFAASAQSVPQTVSAASQQKGKVNVNTATAQELSDRLDGIGDTIASRIVAYREKNGPFRSVEGLKNVEGIGDKKFEAIRDDVTIG